MTEAAWQASRKLLIVSLASHGVQETTAPFYGGRLKFNDSVLTSANSQSLCASITREQKTPSAGLAPEEPVSWNRCSQVRYAQRKNDNPNPMRPSNLGGSGEDQRLLQRRIH